MIFRLQYIAHVPHTKILVPRAPHLALLGEYSIDFFRRVSEQWRVVVCAGSSSPSLPNVHCLDVKTPCVRFESENVWILGDSREELERGTNQGATLCVLTENPPLSVPDAVSVWIHGKGAGSYRTKDTFVCSNAWGKGYHDSMWVDIPYISPQELEAYRKRWETPLRTEDI
jgi:hypothetical protein